MLFGGMLCFVVKRCVSYSSSVCCRSSLCRAVALLRAVSLLFGVLRCSLLRVARLAVFSCAVVLLCVAFLRCCALCGPGPVVRLFVLLSAVVVLRVALLFVARCAPRCFLLCCRSSVCGVLALLRALWFWSCLFLFVVLSDVAPLCVALFFVAR